jgi:hypothetical protein
MAERSYVSAAFFVEELRAMIPEALVDLDALIHVCRDPRSRAYVSESVGSYRVGAYRAAIVTLWVAVVFDFVHKLQELEMSGDAKAHAILEEFRKYQSAADVRSSWEFERKVLERAWKEFELLSRHEYEDLERLFIDRNRCAHPAMNAGDDAYAPSAELARLHIRNAVIHLLQHPPVQGQAALDRLRAEVLSEYFPITVEAAIQHFKHGPLGRPRAALVRNFALANLKHLLGPEIKPPAAPRFIAALGALREMQREIVESAINEKTSLLVRSALLDGRQRNVLRILRYMRDLWPFLEGDLQATLIRYVEAIPSTAVVIELPMSFDCPELLAAGLRRLASATEEELGKIAAARPRVEMIDRAIDLYSQSNDFATANQRAESLILPLMPLLQKDAIVRIVAAAGVNGQIELSNRWKKVRDALRELKVMGEVEFDALLTEHDLAGG